MGLNRAMRVAIISLLVVGLSGLFWRSISIYRADQRAQQASAFLAELERAGTQGSTGGAKGSPSALGEGQTAALGHKPRVWVHVEGAVEQPGVYSFEEGARVHDAIQAAGGALPEGVPGALNLAAPLADGTKLYVFTKEELQPATPPPALAQGATYRPVTQTEAVSSAGRASGGLVNLNTANQAELESVPGIGPATARAILDYRNKNGPFKQVDDLIAVSGIGTKTLEKLRPYLQV